MKKSILFICKKNETYGAPAFGKRSGLYNSTQFIVRSLREHHAEAYIFDVVDNNDIDRLVSTLRPDVVVIEALWVVPSKFDVLKKLHPHVEWHVHLHSHTAFLALEGIAVSWLHDYAVRGVGIIVNSKPAYRSLRVFLDASQMIYLPNVYLGEDRHAMLPNHARIDIGCFGAIRPMKNQLIQALAALKFARSKGRGLNFHINATRSETGGDPVLKNLRALFEQTADSSLIEHKWFEPREFVSFLSDNIDLGMQVSLSETFNVVTADYVTAGVPVVVSKEIPWTCWLSQAKDDDIDHIVSRMKIAWRNQIIVWWNQLLLKHKSKVAQKLWLHFVKSGLK